LFVTLTDYYGYQQLLPIHDPPFVYELEHRHVLPFMYRRRQAVRWKATSISKTYRACVRRACDFLIPRRVSAGAACGDGRVGGEPRA